MSVDVGLLSDSVTEPQEWSRSEDSFSERSEEVPEVPDSLLMSVSDSTEVDWLRPNRPRAAQ